MEHLTIAHWLESRQHDQRRFLERLVNTDSGSADIFGIDEVAQIVRKELENLGFTVNLYSFEKAGTYLMAEKEAGKSEKKTILLGHMDTVFEKGTANQRPYRESGEFAYGPGVLDMKGGICQMIYALKALKEAGECLDHIRIILVGDEEVGHLESDAVALMKEHSQDAAFVFCCESGRLDGKCVTGRKGVASAILEVFGKSAHSGNDFTSGRNAILELADKLMRLNKWNEPDLSLTISPGVITGGTVINAVPDYARAEIDIRFTNPEKLEQFFSESKEAMAEKYIPDTRINYRPVVEYQTMVHDENTEKILNIVNGVLHEQGKPPLETCSVGGGADSSFFSRWGIPAICAFGPRGQGNHTVDECIHLGSLVERTHLLAECLIRTRKLLERKEGEVADVTDESKEAISLLVDSAIVVLVDF